MNNRNESIIIISQMFRSNKGNNIFKKYIDYIRFPFFKSFEKNLKVKFDYPITFLVGQNGSGKSSLLQALFGAPQGKSVGNYWYTTALDPIKDIKRNRHCFIYSFKTEFTNTQVEVLQTRIQRTDKKTGQIKPEVWEPARPQKSYGMPDFIPNGVDVREASQTRWNLLKKDVLYMDFRYSLSAYDKYFYFGIKPNTITLKSKQDIIRKYAPMLKYTFNNNKKTSYYSRKAEIPTILTSGEIKIVENILGKKYKEAKITEHDFYDRTKGFAIQYKTDNLSYSEAYAGSGEVAIVKLVHDIINAKDYSLILLDEPETSLHPTAQKKLIDFVLSQIQKKKLQVVVSTHSPDIIEGMPSEAVKILYENIETGKVNILDNVNPLNAFIHIGRSFSDKIAIIVEDNLAKLIVDKVLENENNHDLFNVKFFPSGESIIKKENMLVYSKEEDTKHFVLFDGDQRCNKVDITELSDSDKNVNNLNKIIKEITGIDKLKFNHDTDRQDQQVDLMLKYIKFHNENVFFLPEQIPEEIIWSNYVLERADITYKEKEEIKSKVELKDKFNLFAKYNYGNNTSEYQFKAYEYFVIRWLKNKDNNYIRIAKIINEIKDKQK